MGKTAFALNLARNAALHPTRPTPVAVFSLEMSAGQLVQRILSAESEIWLEKIARGKMEEHEMKQLYAKGIQRLAQAPIFIDDSAALNIFELRAKCRRLKTRNNIGFIIIDYLQLMSGSSEGKNTNFSGIARVKFKQNVKDIMGDSIPQGKDVAFSNVFEFRLLSCDVERKGFEFLIACR